MQQGFNAPRNSASGLVHNGHQLRSSALAKTASKLSNERVTPRRDPATDERMRMVRVMLDSAEKMMFRLGITVPVALPTQA